MSARQQNRRLRTLSSRQDDMKAAQSILRAQEKALRLLLLNADTDPVSDGHTCSRRLACGCLPYNGESIDRLLWLDLAQHRSPDVRETARLWLRLHPVLSGLPPA